MVPSGIIRASFFPEIEADLVSATLEMPAGATIERTEAVVDRIEEAGQRAMTRVAGGRDPDFLEATYTSVGLLQVQGGATGVQETFRPSLADIRLSLVPSSERSFSSTALEEAWREELGDVPEARSITISSTLLGAGDPVNVQISHPDEQALPLIRDRIVAGLGEMNGVFDIESDQDAGLREIELRLRAEARSLGVTLEDVAS